jgi:hypothetical protein
MVAAAVSGAIPDMTKIPLLTGAYSSQSLTASAQRCINLYMEKNPEGTNFPTAHFPRAGLTKLSSPPAVGRGRCLYPATNGDLYAVIDQAAYYIDPDFVFHPLGNLLIDKTTPVSMADNGQQLLMVDGTPYGYTITLPFAGVPGRVFNNIQDLNFKGSPRVDFIDSFLVYSIPGTNQWGSTQSDQITPFNALFIGVKTAWPDNVLCVVTVERLCWLFGPQKSEVWFNAGSTPFPFNLLSGNIIEQGCCATYSPAKMDTNVYWLSQSPEGDRMVMRGNSQLVAQRISTHAIEYEWRSYARVDDAIGSTYQVSGHSFYMIHFPTADKTWVYDEATQQWHEDNWIDVNGVLHRSRNTFNAFAYGRNLALDWATGDLLHLDPNATDDNGNLILILRAFPHVLNDLKQVSYSAFTADVATGLGINTGEAQAPLDGFNDDFNNDFGGPRTNFQSPFNQGFSSGFGPMTNTNLPQLSMRMSRDGGYNFGNNRVKTLIGSGNYRTMQRFRGNGIGRDAVFEISSTAAMISAINGAYVDILESLA